MGQSVKQVKFVKYTEKQILMEPGEPLSSFFIYSDIVWLR